MFSKTITDNYTFQIEKNNEPNRKINGTRWLSW